MTSCILTHPLFAHCGKLLTLMSRKVELDLQPASYSTPNAPSISSATLGILEACAILRISCSFDDDTFPPVAILAALSSSSCSQACTKMHY